MVPDNLLLGILVVYRLSLKRTLVQNQTTILLGVGGSGGGSETLSQGDVLSVTLIGNANTASIDTLASNVFFGSLTVSSTELTVDSIAGNNDNFIAEGNTTQVDTAITQLDDALTTLRSNAQTLGSNVALLQTRLDFTEQYVNNLAGGAAKLTLADINEEGANLLALQTRQQLGINSLALAAQSERSILALFG